MKKTIKDFDLENKRVIIRCDLNVPMKDGIILDHTRIKASVRTIKYAISHEAKVILLSHLGKVKTLEDKKDNSLYPVAFALSNYLKCEVKFSFDTKGKELTEMVNNLKAGEVLLVENTRFEDIEGKKESNCNLNLAKYWASLGDIFINDAYGSCHRNHASVTGIPKYLPSGMGFLVEKEIKKLDNILNSSTHPFIVIMGGKKVDDKIVLIERLLEKCDKLLIGGAMSFTFLKAKGYNTGSSIVSEDKVEFAKRMLEKYPNKINLPSDFAVLEDDKVIIKDIEEFNNKDIGYDIGNKTLRNFYKDLSGAKRVIINGPMGMFEDNRFTNGTNKLLKYLDKNKIKTLVGGGDTASSVNKLGYQDSFYHVSTGGGATLKYMEDDLLVGIEAIDDVNEE